MGSYRKSCHIRHASCFRLSAKLQLINKSNINKIQLSDVLMQNEALRGQATPREWPAGVAKGQLSGLASPAPKKG
jgi:hypothetical protein